MLHNQQPTLTGILIHTQSQCVNNFFGVQLICVKSFAGRCTVDSVAFFHFMGRESLQRTTVHGFYAFLSSLFWFYLKHRNDELLLSYVWIGGTQDKMITLPLLLFPQIRKSSSCLRPCAQSRCHAVICPSFFQYFVAPRTPQFVRSYGRCTLRISPLPPQ